MNIQNTNIQVQPPLSLRSRVHAAALHKEPGLDGILVTIGLCIIALLLCVVMKDSLAEFIEVLVASMTDKAKEILAGPVTAGVLGGIL